MPRIKTPRLKKRRTSLNVSLSPKRNFTRSMTRNINVEKSTRSIKQEKVIEVEDSYEQVR